MNEGSQMRDCEEKWKTEGDRVKSNLANDEGYTVPGNCEPFNVNAFITICVNRKRQFRQHPVSNSG